MRARCAVASACEAMPCYKPLKGWKSKDVSRNGKHVLTFNRARAYVDLPMEVPCGQCIGCRLERSRQWAVRCVHEAQLHESNCFLTLTYDDAHLPYGGTLIKKHFQDFMKRLRKRVGQVRFFHCGEYGDISRRPHYHALIFGFDFPDKVLYSRNGQGHNIYESPLLSELWGLGRCTIGALTFESAAYTARYVMKKVTGQLAEDHYEVVVPSTGEVVQLLPEYITMSLKPGIGSGWYDRFSRDVFPDDFVVVRGIPQGAPRFYLRRLEKDDVVAFKRVKRKRIERAFEVRDNCTDERLAVREKVRTAQISSLKRDLS